MSPRKIFGKFSRIVSVFTLRRNKRTRPVELRHPFVQHRPFATTECHDEDRPRIALPFGEHRGEAPLRLGQANDRARLDMRGQPRAHSPEGPPAA